MFGSIYSNLNMAVITAGSLISSQYSDVFRCRVIFRTSKHLC